MSSHRSRRDPRRRSSGGSAERRALAAMTKQLDAEIRDLKKAQENYRNPDWRMILALQPVAAGDKPRTEDANTLALRHAMGVLLAGKVEELPLHQQQAIGIQFQDTGIVRAVLRARIVAKSRVETIARKMDLAVETIRTFMDWFFDVKKYLDDDDDAYIRSRILRLRPDPEPSFEILLAHCAYTGEPASLEDAIDYLGLSSGTFDPQVLNTKLNRESLGLRRELLCFLQPRPYDGPTQRADRAYQEFAAEAQRTGRGERWESFKEELRHIRNLFPFMAAVSNPLLSALLDSGELD